MSTDREPKEVKVAECQTKVSISKVCGEICMAHRLMRHEGKCKQLHGHNYLVSVELVAQDLNTQGMVMDFSEINKHVKTFLSILDHKTMLEKGDPMIAALFAADFGGHLFVVDFPPTVEHVANFIFQGLYRGGLCDVLNSVTLMETDSSSATVTKNTA